MGIGLGTNKNPALLGFETFDSRRANRNPDSLTKIAKQVASVYPRCPNLGKALDTHRTLLANCARKLLNGKECNVRLGPHSFETIVGMQISFRTLGLINSNFMQLPTNTLLQHLANSRMRRGTGTRLVIRCLLQFSFQPPFRSHWNARIQKMSSS